MPPQRDRMGWPFASDRVILERVEDERHVGSFKNVLHHLRSSPGRSGGPKIPARIILILARMTSGRIRSHAGHPWTGSRWLCVMWLCGGRRIALPSCPVLFVGDARFRTGTPFVECCALTAHNTHRPDRERLIDQPECGVYAGACRSIKRPLTLSHSRVRVSDRRDKPNPVRTSRPHRVPGVLSSGRRQ